MRISHRRVATFDLKTADMASTPADNADLFSIIVPKNRTINIYNLKADVRAAAGSGCTVELTDASNVVLCEVAIDATGIVSTADTVPVKFTNTAATDTKLKLRVNGSLDTTTDVTFEVHLTEPGSK